MTDQEDGALVRRSVSGDKRAFEALVVKYQKPMFNAALRIVNDYEDAADVTQTAFVKAYERLKQFDHSYKFYSWLYRITVNESLTFVTGKRRFERLDEGIASPEKSADEVFSEGDASRIVEVALMKLSPDYRVVVVLSHFRELSYKEISDVLGISENKVKSRLYTARQQLKNVLVRKGVLANGE
jgi:RNA polymerase sigma-70 factor, ECF subfamily